MTVGRWSSSVVTIFFLRSAIVVLSRSLTPASNSRGRPILIQESHVPAERMHGKKRAFGRIPCLFRIHWSLRWFDVCICMDASEEGVCVRGFVKDFVSWRRKSERTMFKRTFQVHPCPVACAPFHRARCRCLECSSSDENDENEVSLTRKESRLP